MNDDKKIFIFLILDQLYLFIQAGISVDEIESKHGVSTLDKLLRTKVPCSQKLKIQNEVSKLLLDGANPNLAQEGEDSPLVLAIKLNLFEIADKLIEAGANVNHIGENKTNPANSCCVSGPYIFFLFVDMDWSLYLQIQKQKY